MLLNEYLECNDLTVYEFAIICRLSNPVIYRILKGHNVSPRTAKRVHTVTKGAVDYKKLMVYHGAEK